jgi:hypothetical protein
MAAFVVNTKTEKVLAPGKTGHWKWNNAAPQNAVWSANVVPVMTGDTASGFDEDVSLEVTRVWRRLIVTEEKSSPQSQFANVNVEHEVHYEVKNVGSRSARFVVFLSAVS